MEDYDEEPNINEKIFHNNVRENIIYMLVLLSLVSVGQWAVGRWWIGGAADYFCERDPVEARVFRIAHALCAASLAAAAAAAVLLPASIVANEVLVHYPNAYLVQWLNADLIHGLWSYIFLFSNLSLFIFLPFAYLFTESEGFFGHRKGLWSRVYETAIVLGLLAIVVLGMTYVISSLINEERSDVHTILSLWSYYLPFLYSCISFVGALILLVCTPLGFIRLFDVVGKFLIKPQFLHDLNEEYYACAMEEECLRRRLRHVQNTGKYFASPVPMSFGLNSNGPIVDEYNILDSVLRLRNGELQSEIGTKLCELENRRKTLDKQRKTSSFRRNFVYPVCMLLLIGLTIIAVLMVVQNTVSLLIGIKALPSSSKQFTLGVSSLSKLGPFGAALEIVLIVYFIVTSSIGLYTAPCMKRIRPAIKNTPFTVVIANCALLLTISSALPLLSKILGITNFDLLGDFGKIEWLDNFEIVLLYNLSFATAATLCVSYKFTAKVRRELYNRLVENYTCLTNHVSFLN